MQITTKLRERKDHFVITIYKKDRQNFDVSIGDIIILKLGKHELVRPIRNDFHVSLPKNMLRNKTHGNKIKLSILEITKREDCLNRPQNMLKDNKLDVRNFIPRKTLFGYPLYIIKRGDNNSYVWYPIGGGVRHANIKNCVDIDKIAELIGFYFGDGSTCKGMRSFRLTNCEPSVLDYCLGILEEMGISRKNFKIQIIYSTDKELTEETKSRCINFWSRTLKVNKERIVSVNKAKNVRETLQYGSARIFIDNATLVEIFLRGLLNSILTIIKNPESNTDKRLLKGFMRGLLAAEGSPELNRYNSVRRIGISYDPHSSELSLYKRLLKNLGMSYGKTNGNELYVYGYKNYKKLFEINAFKMHKKRNQKFVRGFKNHKFSKLKLSF